MVGCLILAEWPFVILADVYFDIVIWITGVSRAKISIIKWNKIKKKGLKKQSASPIKFVAVWSHGKM